LFSKGNCSSVCSLRGYHAVGKVTNWVAPVAGAGEGPNVTDWARAFCVSKKLSTMKKVLLPEEAIRSLFGPYDENVKYLESLIPVRINLRGNELTIEGDDAESKVVEAVLNDYASLFQEGKRMSNEELKAAFKQIAEDRAFSLRDYFTKARINPSGKKQVMARSSNQRRYLEAIEQHDMVFGIGPAGTGKTFLAVAMAVQALMQKRVNRIVLARPAVEAGEKLGFLPGDLQDKVDPYLRPLYDALFDLVDYERVTKLLEKRVIEVAPLAFMRGRAQPLDSPGQSADDPGRLATDG
jgi:phosphate starvation-inducible protein PhoH and related proteins